MESTIGGAVFNFETPGAVLLAADRSGSLDYAVCLGRRGISLDELPLTLDTVMRMASATKLITSVACMQCVERGLLDLDKDISQVISELAELRVLTGFDHKDQPELREPKRPLTLRHLLSHSSVFCYDALHPLLIKYRGWQGMEIQPDFETVAERFLYPLVYDSGDGWSYGPNLEWAGKAIERVTGATLGDFVQRNVCAPLEIADMTFKIQQRADTLSRRATTCDRDDQGILHAGDDSL